MDRRTLLKGLVTSAALFTTLPTVASSPKRQFERNGESDSDFELDIKSQALVMKKAGHPISRYPVSPYDIVAPMRVNLRAG